MNGTSAWLADHVASLLPKPVTGFLPQATAGACVGESTWESNAHECTGQTCCYWIDVCHYSCHGAAICEKLTSTVVCE